MSIGFLVVALIAGGLTSSHRLASFFDEPVSAKVQAATPEARLDDVAAQLLDSASLLAKGVMHSVEGLTPLGALDAAWVTHYGESFNGQALGCEAGLYSSDNAGIVAVGQEHDARWPCGTVLRICGPGGCIVAQRADGCPGCGANHVDLSEEGLLLVCGPGSGVCQARVEAFELPCQVPSARRAASGGPVETLAALAEVALADRTASLLDLTQQTARTYTCSVRGPYAPLVLQP